MRSKYAFMTTNSLLVYPKISQDSRAACDYVGLKTSLEGVKRSMEAIDNPTKSF